MFRIFLKISLRLAVLFGITLLFVAATRLQKPSGWLAFIRFLPDHRGYVYLMDYTRSINIWLRPYAQRNDYGLAWSADGILAFNASWTVTNGIRFLAADTVTVTDPIHQPYNETQPAWSTDGRLAFTSTLLSNNHRNIFIFDPGDGAIQQITNDNRSHHLDPVWAHDGRLAFQAYLQDPPAVTDAAIEIWHPADNRIQTITDGLGFFQEPSWSPDDRLTFQLGRGKRQLYVYDPKTHVTTAISTVDTTSRVSWSPAGLMTFSALVDNNGSDVFVMDREQNSLTNVVSHPAQDNTPIWLNEQQIAFLSNRTGNPDIYLLDLPTGTVVNLTRSADAESYLTGLP